MVTDIIDYRPIDVILDCDHSCRLIDPGKVWPHRHDSRTFTIGSNKLWVMRDEEANLPVASIHTVVGAIAHESIHCSLFSLIGDIESKKYDQIIHSLLKLTEDEIV